MNKTDDILEKLKNAKQPQIDMTEEIMNSLPDPLPSSPRGGKEAGRTLIFVRAVLSLAAVWIVGFFIYLKYEATVPTKANNTSPFGGGRVEACTLKEVYKSRLCQDCKKSISYTQIRSMLYENK
jgi:hypothetical protein